MQRTIPPSLDTCHPAEVVRWAADAFGVDSLVVEHRYDPGSPNRGPADQLVLNDIGRVHLHVGESIDADIDAHHAEGGRLILIDTATNTTAGAEMIATVRPGSLA